jgi:hypothetical protein
MKRLIPFMLACAPSAPDVCAEFAGAPCVAVEVRHGVFSPGDIDQIRVSGLTGFHTVPDNAGVSPDPPGNVVLPVIVAVVPPADFTGDFSLAVRALRDGDIVGAATATGTLGAGQHARVPVTLDSAPAVPPPAISTLAPPAACVGGAFDLTVTGSDLLVVNGVPPRVHAGDQVIATGGCGVNDGGCTTVTAHVQPLPMEGTQHIVVEDPPPDNVPSAPFDLPVLAQPRIDSLTTQGGMCTGSFEVSGTGFYRTASDGPTVRIDGQVFTNVFPDTCVSVAPGVQACSHLLVALGTLRLGTGNHAVSVLGADPLPCVSKAATLPCF